MALHLAILTGMLHISSLHQTGSSYHGFRLRQLLQSEVSKGNWPEVCYHVSKRVKMQSLLLQKLTVFLKAWHCWYNFGSIDRSTFWLTTFSWMRSPWDSSLFSKVITNWLSYLLFKLQALSPRLAFLVQGKLDDKCVVMILAAWFNSILLHNFLISDN